MRSNDEIDDNREIEIEDESSEDSEALEQRPSDVTKVNVQARRRLEEYREEKALRDMLDDDFESYYASL